ncbi:MAG: hypothetical protein Q9191_005106 [Dirinaria sp. TL-2023a]
MAEPISLLASIVELTHVTLKAFHADREQGLLASELAQLLPLLSTLKSRVESADFDNPECERNSITWFSSESAVTTAGLEEIINFVKILQHRFELANAGGKGTGKRKGKAKLKERLVWPFKKHEVGAAIARIERFKSWLGLALQNEELRLSYAIKADTAGIEPLKGDLQDIGLRVETLIANDASRKKQTKDALRQQILTWLSPFESPKSHATALQNHEKGTGQWFLDSDEFRQWVERSGVTLYCPGIPGAGKTVMASLVVEHLRKLFHRDDTAVLYTYCHHREQSSQSLESIISGLLKQILLNKREIPHSLEKAYSAHLEKGIRPSMPELTSILKSMLDTMSRVFLVVDALDEYSQSESALEGLLDNLDALSKDANLMLTSRFAKSLTERYKDAITLEIHAKEADVRHYLRSQMSNLPRCVKQNPSLQQSVEDTISNAVEGMFLLAQLHMRSLADKLTPRSVKAALSQLGRGSGSDAIDAAYTDTWQRIENSDKGYRELAHRVITWIACSSRPLFLNQLQYALAIEPDDEEFDADNLPDPETIMSVCGGLVDIDQETSNIHFAHYTAQEYFARRREELFPKANARLAAICITYLMFDVVPDADDIRKSHTFAGYSACSWSEYVRDSDSEETVSRALKFLDHKAHRQRAAAFEFDSTSGLIITWALQLIDYQPDEKDFHKLEKGKYHIGSGGSALCMASRLGLTEIASSLLQQGPEISWNDDAHPMTALHYAVIESHHDVVRILLKAGARMDIRDQLSGYSWTPLQWASHQGRDAVVETLIAYGADIGAGNEQGKTPLNLALSRRHFTAATLLVKHKPQICYDRSPLIDAAVQNSLDMVRLLLDHGFDVDATENTMFNHTAFDIALSHFHVEMARMLLQKGASLTRANNYFFPWPVQPIQRAAAQGSVETVRLCLDFGADPNTQAQDQYGNKSPTPLIFAVTYGSTSKDGPGYLKTLLPSRHVATARLLLEEGANVAFRDTHGNNALHYAIHYKDLDMARVLLHYGAKWDQESVQNNVGASEIVEDITYRQASCQSKEEYYFEVALAVFLKLGTEFGKAQSLDQGS